MNEAGSCARSSLMKLEPICWSRRGGTAISSTARPSGLTKLRLPNSAPRPTPSCRNPAPPSGAAMLRTRSMRGFEAKSARQGLERRPAPIGSDVGPLGQFEHDRHGGDQAGAAGRVEQLRPPGRIRRIWQPVALREIEAERRRVNRERDQRRRPSHEHGLRPFATNCAQRSQKPRRSSGAASGTAGGWRRPSGRARPAPPAPGWSRPAPR